MASNFPLWVSFSIALISSCLFCPAISLTCTSQKFSSNRLFSNCSDLPSLESYLHWNYNVSNSSLSIAFVSKPAKSGGWVAWAINPTAEGMAGSQALIAWKSDASVVVKTYNISSYASIVESKLSFDVWDLSAEESDGSITIFASAKVPTKTEKLNQVWQVGPAVSNGMPAKHDFGAENLKSKGELELVSSSESTTTNTGSGSNASEGSLMKEKLRLGIYVSLLWLLASILNF